MDVEQDQEMTAHLIEVEPVALLGCTMTELKYLSIVCVGFWAALLLLFTAPFGLIVMLVTIPVSVFLGGITVWRISIRIKRRKVGKPHHYYIHKFQRDVLSRFGVSPWLAHQGRFRIGRTHGKGVVK